MTQNCLSGPPSEDEWPETDDSNTARFLSEVRDTKCGSCVGGKIGLDLMANCNVLGVRRFSERLPTFRHAARRSRFCSDRLRGINSGEYKPQSSCTLSDFVQRNWLPEVLPTLKYSTKKHYEYIVNVHLIPAFGEMQLRLITRESVQSFLNGKLRGGLAWKTVKHIRTTFGTVLGAAETQGLIRAILPARPNSLVEDRSKKGHRSHRT